MQDWYSVAKITSEQAALEYGKQTGMDVVTVNPAVVFGPLLQPTLNTSCQFLVYFLKGFTLIVIHHLNICWIHFS
jgi:nucleoside-diphosphate-sugar epimerase